MTTMTELFGPVISTYTRAQALEDGTLVDLNKIIPIDQSGYRYPVACTAAVYSIIDKATLSKMRDEFGIVHDILHMSRHPYRKLDNSTVVFSVRIGRRRHEMKMQCHPGDQDEPVLTIMLIDED